MTTKFLILAFCLDCGFWDTLLADQKYPDPWLPLPRQVGSWSTITERFMKWKITEFEYGGGIADGGSLGFRFKTADGAAFDVLVVCSSWWTEQDWKRKHQPIYLWFQDKAYRIPKDGEAEKRLLVMLNQAAMKLKGVGRKHPRYIERLRDVVKSRALPDNDWPFDRLDLKEQ